MWTSLNKFIWSSGKNFNMKIFLVFFLMGSLSLAKMMQIPENCLSDRKSPCLTKVTDTNETVLLDNQSLQVNKNSIVQWDAFKPELQASILQGGLRIEKNEKALKLNQIQIAKENQMIVRQQNELKILDISTFLLSTYTLSSIQSNSVLEHSVFLEKAELIQFVAHFFDQKKPFVVFLKSIEKKWKVELSTQAAIQTRVLKRAIASDETTLKQQQLAEYKSLQAHKKVREEFFYRTFYR